MGGRIQFIDEYIGWIDSDGGLYKTTDGGFNWELQAPPVTTFFFVNENIGWYVSGNQIRYTSDGGQTWTQQNSPENNSLQSIYFVDQNNGWISGDNGTILHTINGGTPVELKSFAAEIVDNIVLLKWSTATETNNKGFEIERSRKLDEGNQNWNKIGYIAGYGTTTEPRYYSYTDTKLKEGKFYYRLKQLDYNGSYNYSKEIDIDVTSPNKFTLEQNYPNPFNPVTTLRYSIPQASQVNIKVFDVLGNERDLLVNEEKPAGSYSVKFDGSSLSSGIYFYRMKAGDYSETKKLILLK